MFDFWNALGLRKVLGVCKLLLGFVSCYKDFASYSEDVESYLESSGNYSAGLEQIVDLQNCYGYITHSYLNYLTAFWPRGDHYMGFDYRGYW